MNKSTIVIRMGVLICLSIMFITCKNAKEDAAPVLHILTSQLICAEGDSLNLQLMADNQQVSATQWTTSTGTIDNTGKLIAPAHIDMDTIPVTIVAAYQNQQTSVQVKITKTAFKQTAVSYTQTIQPLLTNNCNFSGCHANGSRAGKVELSIYDSVRTNLIPYNAPASKLYFSLIKTDPLRVMPPAGKMHAGNIQAVWLWIEQGARNN